MYDRGFLRDGREERSQCRHPWTPERTLETEISRLRTVEDVERATRHLDRVATGFELNLYKGLPIDRARLELAVYAADHCDGEFAPDQLEDIMSACEEDGWDTTTVSLEDKVVRMYTLFDLA